MAEGTYITVDIGETYLEVYPNETQVEDVIHTIIPLTEEEMNRLGDGYTYTVQTFLRATSNTSYIRDWVKNYRIGVFNNPIEENITVTTVDDEEVVTDSTDYDNLSEADILKHAEFWGETIETYNEFNNLECKFRYLEKYPVYIIITGDNTNFSPTPKAEFTFPCVVENYNGYIDPGVYPSPILDVIGEDTSAELSVAKLSQSDTVVLYDFPLDEAFGDDDSRVIRGLAIHGDMQSHTDDFVLNASLVNGENQSRNRSIVLDENNPKNYSDAEFNIGQVGDLWGFKTGELTNLEDWEIHMSFSNVLNMFDAEANFGNVQLVVYSEEVEDQLHRMYVDGEDTVYYGAFLQDVKVPSGLKTDTDYITVDGTDTNDPYRQNITAKTIEVEFDIDGCDLEGATLSLREITRLFTNERDQYNRPIPKRLEFSHYPDVFWEYVMEEPIDAEVEISSYKCKAKFVIPAGTSYDKQVTSTGVTGYVGGLASIRPNIQVYPTESLVSITELFSGQEFHMGYGGDWTGKLVEIDCDDRIVWLKESEDDDDPINISYGVDINSDWFVLNGEYEFGSVGCAIRSVDWQERW